MGKFVHLHIHSEFSLLDGANRIKDIPVRAKQLGMDAIAITDHGVMYGVIDFYKACQKEGIKPIIGCEVYVAPRTRFDKENGKNNKYNHLILLAKNNQGYKNLKPVRIKVNNERDEELLNVNQISFASHELNLYLDNYPNDKEALNLFTKYRKMANDLIQNYERRYGPLTVSGEVNSNTPFRWESEKWPWEV